jgi:hypothetical protein
VNRAALRILVLAFLACVFGWKTYRAWTMPVFPTDGTRAGDPLPLRLSASVPPGAPGGDVRGALTSVLGRPVFRPDRRPFRPDTPAASARNYEMELSRYAVLGVLMMGDEQKALVVGKGAQGERWEVGAGDELPGFTVKSVSPDGLVLAADGREFSLPLYARGPGAAGKTLRTEVAPASPDARQPPGKNSVVPVPGGAVPPSPSGQPPRRYPRTYVPGRR